MAKLSERHSSVAEEAGENVKRFVKVGPAGVLPVVMITLGLIAIFVLGIMLLFR